VAKRRGFCGWGCIVLGSLLVVLLVFAGYVVFVRTDVPARLGLREPPVERLLSGEPDRQAAQMIMEELQAGGLDTQGMYLYVLPIEGQSYSLAYAVLDAAGGFHFDSADGSDGVTDLLTRMAASDTAGAYGVGRVAMEYRNTAGTRILTLTAPTDIIRNFANGTISRDAFMQALEGDFDAQELYGEFLE
jgi:hypothetical protein